jgi:digeranylgeranylglycerophospholipid reductase
MDAVDVLVVGAGPAGSCAARAAAAGGASVLIIEQRPNVGLPVQCAEYVPAQIVGHIALPQRAIAQRVQRLRTHLPDGEIVDTKSAGYVLDRWLFDKALAATAHRSSAQIWTGARALERTERGVLIRKHTRTTEVHCRVVIGADGPRSTVGSWMGQSITEFIDAQQVEVVLSQPRDATEVFFDPFYAGGYGWLFPKGDTANVGVGVNRALGGDPADALEHLLARLGIAAGTIVGHTAGPIPCGGSVERLVQHNSLLVGDAAGHTHPVTGAGILTAVISGTLAGEAASAAVRSNNLSSLARYEREWSAYLGGPLQHALGKRRELDRRWTDDRPVLSAAVRDTWIAFRAYSQRETRH